MRRDIDILLDSGFDAVLFCNEGDRPYRLKATFEGIAMMARVVTEVAPPDRPFGVDYLTWNPVDTERAARFMDEVGAVRAT